MKKNLGEYTMPTGAKGNVFSINSWVSAILGGIVLIISFATAQNVASFLSGKARFVDSTIEKPYRDPQPVTSNIKQKVML